MAVVQFAYDGQIRRFVIQFIRMLSNFQVEFGKDGNGVRALQTIPVYYGDVSRQAAMILRGNSENTLNAVPAMAVYIAGLTYDRDRLQNPYHESVVTVRERTFDESTQAYGRTQDGMYTVERLMPAPYKLTMKCSVWTSNTEQKHQILEQLVPLFNPGFEIQNTDNFLDWTSLSVALLTEVQYTNRTVPAGSDESYDIAELTFELPIWITLPAKVKKMGVVTQIIANIYNENGDFTLDDYTQGALTTQRFTPLDCQVLFIGNTLTLYKSDANLINGQIYGTKLRWLDVVNFYGKITNGVSQIRLTFPFTDGPHEIVGTVAYSPTDATQLLITPFTQTLPANTLTPVNAIIDPLNVTVDANILSPSTGTRYLILHGIGNAESEGPVAWAGTLGTNLFANANDIIEWNGSYWFVSFDSKTRTEVQYVTNLNTTVQYRWTGSNWIKAYEGLYATGNWSLVL